MNGMRKAFTASLVFMVGALVVAGCSSSGGSGAAASSSSGQPPSGAASGGLAIAEARVTAFSARPSGIGQTTPITNGVQSAKGKKIAFVQCALTTCKVVAQAVEEAAAAVGMTVVPIVLPSFAPDAFQTAFQSAIDAKVDAVLTTGATASFIAPQLATLAAAHIPVLTYSSAGSFLGGGWTANLLGDSDLFFEGALMADIVAVDSRGTANTSFVYASDSPSQIVIKNGYQKELARVCSSCNTDFIPVASAALATGGNVQSTISDIQRNPKVKWIVLGTDSLYNGLDAGLTGAGIGDDVKAVMLGGEVVDTAAVKQSNRLAAVLSTPNVLRAWAEVDAMLRAFAGQAITPLPEPASVKDLADIGAPPDMFAAGLPLQIVTQKDLADTPANQLYLPDPNFREQYKKLWGIG